MKGKDADKLINADQKHVKKAKELKFKSLTAAIVRLCDDKHYKKVRDIYRALGMSATTLSTYREKLKTLGIDSPRQGKSFKIPPKGRERLIKTIAGRKNKIDSEAEERYLMPEIDVFGFTRGWCR